MQSGTEHPDQHELDFFRKIKFIVQFYAVHLLLKYKTII